MKRLLSRLATTLLVAPLTVVAGSGAAEAVDVTVPGCYGAASAVVCDATLSLPLPYTVETYETTIPVCAGTCRDVEVTLVRLVSTGDQLVVCATWQDRYGNQTGVCSNDPVIDPIDPSVLDALRGAVADVYDNLVTTVCFGFADFQCTYEFANTLYRVGDIIR